jgi:sugar phosphate isomerase/epimerase
VTANQTQLAVQMYTLRDFTKTPADLVKTLAKVRAIGYRAIQISAFPDMPAADADKAMRDNGLICCSTHVGWERFRDDLPRVIDEHRLWGCTHPAIGSMPTEFRTAEGVVRFAKLAEQVGKQLAAAGMDWSYHNHDFELAKVNGKTWLDLLYDNSDPRYVKAELDTHWIQAGGGNPAAWIAKYAGRMPILHLKDYVIGPDRARRFAEIGQGNLDWPSILAAARTAGVEWYCVEQDLCYERDPFDSLKLSLDFLQAQGLR